ncbi:MAG: Uma2 family endonuclease [Thermomicrobiales bacterium]|nr:Uma2 family endonuclease [Thermomicrobiales bacterium]
MVVTSAPPRPLTYEDFANLPESLDRYEILQGELIVSPPPRSEHQDVSFELGLALATAIQRSPEIRGKVYAAPIGVRLSPHDFVQPDLIYISVDRRSILVDGIVDGAPDLVVEVASPSTQRYDRVRKMALYQETGVREYWIVDPKKRSFEVYELVNDAYRLIETDDGRVRSKVLPEVDIDAGALFDSVWWTD